VDSTVLDSEYLSNELASVSCAHRILSNSQFLEKRVEEVDDPEDQVKPATSEESEPVEKDEYSDYTRVAQKALDAIRGRWAETRDGGLALTGNKYWRPLPTVIGTTAYYHDESCGLDPFVATNPNPERWGPYISSDDDDSSEVSDDSSDTLESEISSEFISSTSSEGEYSDMEDNLADIENYGVDSGGLEEGDGGGADLFSSVASIAKSARKAAPNYALSYDDVFGEDVRSAGGLFDDIKGATSDLFSGLTRGNTSSGPAESAGAPAMREGTVSSTPPSKAGIKKPKGLFDSDSDSDGDDLFGLRKKSAGEDLFASPMPSNPLAGLKAESATTSKPLEEGIESMKLATDADQSKVVAAPKLSSPLFDDSDSEEEKLFNAKNTAVSAPKRDKEGLFD
jgi:hypothetical protein